MRIPQLLLLMLIWNFATSLYGQEQRKPPAWAAKLSEPDAQGYRYFVGVASDMESRELGLERAWVNGLSSIAKTQFPFLLKVNESSSESLKGAEYNRTTKTSIDRVQWLGLEEDIAKGSPYFEVREIDGKEKIAVYRLLRWGILDMKKEEGRLLSEAEKQSTAVEYSSIIGFKNVPTGSLRIATTPPGATILLNGEFVGQSNAVFKKIGSGLYQAAFQLNGYILKEEQITVTPGRDQNLSIKLERNMGTLSIATNPTGALIFVDNVPIEQRAPVSLQKYHGDYSIRVESPGYYSEAKMISVSFGGEEASFTLKAKPGKLSVVTNPSQAKILMDGQLLGLSNILNQTVRGGEHRIQVEKEGFETVDKMVNVNETRGQTVAFNLKVALEKSEKSKANRRISYISGAVGLGLVLGALSYKDQSEKSYQLYESASNAQDATRYRKETETSDQLWQGSAILSGISFSIAYLYW